ncbi:MAG: IS66 family transposase [Oscillospiraceae bacterium]
MTYEELKKAYEEMSVKCSELEKKIEDKEHEIEGKNREIEDKNLEIENLIEQLLKRNQMLFGKKSEKSKCLYIEGQTAFDDISPVNEAEEQSDENAAEPDAETITEEPKKSHAHRGRKLHKNLPKKVITFKLDEDKCTCPHCSGKLHELAPEHITSRLAIIPGKVYMVEYNRMKYMCPECDKKSDKAVIVAAPNNTPAPVTNKGLADASLVADIIQRKYQLGVPLYRQEKYWEAQGIYINRTSMANWVIDAGRWFAPVVDLLWKYNLKEPILNMDETELKVLKINGKPADKKCWMWICAAGARASKQIAIYNFRTDRKKSTAQAMLENYNGIVQSDGYVAYGDGDYINAGCWSHCRRRFWDSIPKKNKKCKAAHAVMLIDKAMGLEKMAREEKYDDKKLLEMRHKEVKPVIDEFYDFITSLSPGKGSHLCEAVSYAQNQKKKLLVFLEHPEVEMTNNLAERTVKPFVIDRKNFLFSDTEKGAEASAAAMTIIETAKRNNLDIYGYLLYLLTALPALGKNPSEDQLVPLLPWSDSLPQYCKAAYSEILE